LHGLLDVGLVVQLVQLVGLKHELAIRMGNSPSTGHGGEEDHVIRDNIAGDEINERPTEDMYRNSKSSSNETSISDPLQWKQLSSS